MDFEMQDLENMKIEHFEVQYENMKIWKYENWTFWKYENWTFLKYENWTFWGSIYESEHVLAWFRKNISIFFSEKQPLSVFVFC